MTLLQHPLCINALLMILLFIFSWWIAKKIDNYSIVDAIWALSFTASTLIFTLATSGWAPRQALLLLLVGLWSGRLGLFLTRRIHSHHPKEDRRYIELRKEYGSSVERRFFWFFQYQAYSIIILTVPFFWIAQNPEPSFSIIEGVGTALVLLSIWGEARADAQKRDFKANPINQGKNCEIGWWARSRHPNYFFESLIWWGFFIVALGTPSGWAMIYAPILMLLLLLKVTGIPMSERNSLQTYGQQYIEYQNRVPSFFPKLFVLLLFVCSFSQAKDVSSKPAIRTAKIYEIGKTDQDPLYTLTSEIVLTSDGFKKSKTEVKNFDQTIAMQEEAEIDGTRLRNQKIDHFQRGERYRAETSKNELTFITETLASGKTETKRIPLADSLVTGPVSESFVVKNWDALLDGKTIKSDLGVFEIQDTVGFKFWLKRKEKQNGRDIAVIGMKPSSFFIGLVVKTIDLHFESSTKKLVRYVGRTPLLDLRKSKPEPFDGEIIYSD